MAEKPTILLVEDSLVQATLLKRVFIECGYRVETASNGVDGIEKARKLAPGVIISDITMPLMNGYEMCHKIKLDKELQSIPVILLTNLNSTQDIIDGITSKADYYITKPYNKEYLLHLIAVLTMPANKCDEEYISENLLNTASRNDIMVNANLFQVLNFLISTYENSLYQNKELMWLYDTLRDLNKDLKERISELQVSEESYKRLINDVPVVVYKIDKDGRFTFINEAISEFGYTADELIGKHFCEIISPVDFPSISRNEVLSKLEGQATGIKNAPKLFDERRCPPRGTNNLIIRLLRKRHGEKLEEYVPVEINSRGLYWAIQSDDEKMLIGTVGTIKEMPQ